MCVCKLKINNFSITKGNKSSKGHGLWSIRATNLLMLGTQRRQQTTGGKEYPIMRKQTNKSQLQSTEKEPKGQSVCTENDSSRQLSGCLTSKMKRNFTSYQKVHNEQVWHPSICRNLYQYKLGNSDMCKLVCRLISIQSVGYLTVSNKFLELRGLVSSYKQQWSIIGHSVGNTKC